MKKSDIFSLPVITGIAFFVLVVSASYAFFAANINSTNTIVVNVQTPASRTTFTSTPGTNITLSPSIESMATASTTAKATSNSTLNVTLKSSANNVLVSCQYDVAFVWDTTTQYTSPSITLPYTNGSTYNYEISINGAGTNSASNTTYDTGALASTNGNMGTNNASSEKNLDTTNFVWIGTKNVVGYKTILVDNAKIYSNSTTGTVTSWNFTIKFYVLPVSQKSIAGKSFLGHIQVINVAC